MKNVDFRLLPKKKALALKHSNANAGIALS
jgi:hypothetical protein